MSLHGMYLKEVTTRNSLKLYKLESTYLSIEWYILLYVSVLNTNTEKLHFDYLKTEL